MPTHRSEGEPAEDITEAKTGTHGQSLAPRVW
jgi:hypothetical protein